MYHSETIRLQAVEQPDANWDETLRGIEHATMLQSSRWGAVWSRAYGQRSWGILAESNGVCVAALLLIEKRSLVFGRYLVSLPYFDAAGPAGSDELAPILAEEAVRLAARRGLGHVDIRSGRALDLEADGASGKVHVVLDLAADRDAQLAAFGKKVRSQVRRGLREATEVAVGGAELCDAFYDIYSTRMKDLGSPPHSRAVFEAILEEFPDEARVVLVHGGDGPCSAGLMLRVGTRAYLPWAATLRSGLPRSLNMALYYELFRSAIEWGADSFDLGRCDAEGSHLRFKLQWGGEAHPLYWYRLPVGDAQSDAGGPDRGLMEKASRVWRHLPLSWTRKLGPRIIRNLS